MSHRSERLAAPFTAAERELLRRELCRHFGEDPRIADGIFLRTWRGGERRNQPRIPPAVQTMLERGLVELRTTSRGPRAFFTEAGLAALRQLVLDRRAMDPERFGHLRIELGLKLRLRRLTLGAKGLGAGAEARTDMRWREQRAQRPKFCLVR